MDERGRERTTGQFRRPAVQEASDPARKPVAQWVVSGKTVLPADEVYGSGPDGIPPPRPRSWGRFALVFGIVTSAFGTLLAYLLGTLP